MSAQRSAVTYARDVILFVLGVVIILKQAGLGFPAPSGGPSLELLSIGALFCNGPLFLQYLALRRGGISGSSAGPPPPEPAPPLPLPSTGPAGGDA